MYLDKANEVFARSGIANPDEIVPCTQQEVEALEQLLGNPLPQSYKEFLLWMGHGAGIFLRGSDCFYNRLIDIQQWAVELLEEDNRSSPMPNGSFVFFMHQGYQFNFFLTLEGDDPPVYHYFEGMGDAGFSCIYTKFSDFIITEIEGHRQLIASGNV